MSDDELAELEQAVRHALVVPVNLQDIDAAQVQWRLQQILTVIEERRRLWQAAQAKEGALQAITTLARQERPEPVLFEVIAQVATKALGDPGAGTSPPPTTRS